MPALEAQAHLRQLRGILGIDQVASLTGVSRLEVWRIRTGRVHHIRAETAALLLALRRQHPKAGGTLVSSWRTKKLVKALVGEGWTQADLERMAGRRPGAFAGRFPMVRRSTQDVVEELYRRLMGEALLEDDALPGAGTARQQG